MRLIRVSSACGLTPAVADMGVSAGAVSSSVGGGVSGRGLPYIMVGWVVELAVVVHAAYAEYTFQHVWLCVEGRLQVLAARGCAGVICLAHRNRAQAGRPGRQDCNHASAVVVLTTRTASCAP